MGGGGRGHGGRGGGGLAEGAPGGNTQALRQLFWSVFGVGGGANGGGGAGGGRRGGKGARAREGEWPCTCGFPNRAYRSHCYACGRERPSARAQSAAGGKGKGGGEAIGRNGNGNGDKFGGQQQQQRQQQQPGGKGMGYVGTRRGGGGGPVGAGGARPMLASWGDRVDTSTTAFKVEGRAARAKGVAGERSEDAMGKGPPTAASTCTEGWRNPGCSGGMPSGSGGPAAAGGPKGCWAKPPKLVDADGFTTVQPRRTWQPAEQMHRAANDGPAAEHAQVADTRQRWSDQESDDEMYAEDDLEAEEQYNVGNPGDGDDADPQRLRSVYEAYARAVRDMERRMRGDGDQEDPALRTLRDARDEAERAWRGAKPPAPLPIRMGRAQTKLDKANAALRKARHAIEEFDEWAGNQRADLVRKAEEARQWYLWRNKQMEDLHAEAAGRACSNGGGAGDSTGCNPGMAGRIVDEWLPEVQAIMEHLQGNPEVEERLANLAAGMHSASQDACGPGNGATQHYDIGGDGEAWGHPTNQGHEDAHRDSEAPSPANNNATKGGKAAWRPEGAGRWAKAKPEHGACQAPAVGTQLMQRPNSGDDAGNAALATAVGTASPSAGGATASSGNKRGAEDSADAKGAVRQKTEAEAREEADRQRAAELIQQQQATIAAQQASHEAGAGGFGSQAAQSAAAQQFLDDVCKTVERARRLGIDPTADGRQLVELSPMELTQWVAEKLGD